MPRQRATSSIVSVESQPFSSWAMMSALITADCLRSGGYFATSRSIFLSDSAESIGNGDCHHLSVDLAEDDVLRTDDRDGVGDHVAARHLVERGEVGKTRRA